LAIRAWPFQEEASKKKSKKPTKDEEVGFANGAAQERDKFLKL